MDGMRVDAGGALSLYICIANVLLVELFYDPLPQSLKLTAVQIRIVQHASNIPICFAKTNLCSSISLAL